MKEVERILQANYLGVQVQLPTRMQAATSFPIMSIGSDFRNL
jgi:hypothetical protein